MRRSILVYFAAGTAVSALACTAVLGDFTVNGAATGDGGTGDGAITGDGGGGDGGVGDGSADAPPPLKPLSCAITPPKVSFSYADIDGGVNLGDSPRLIVYQLPSHDFRIIVPGYQTLVYADFNGNESQPVHFKTLSLGAINNNTWILTVSRFAAGAQSTPGTAIVSASTDQNGQTTIQLVRFDDGANAPGAPMTLIDGSGGVLPTGLSGQTLGGAIEVVDAPSNDYLVAITYATSPMLFTVAGAHVRGAPAHPKVIDTNLPPNQPIPYSIARDAANAWLLLSPPSSNGPPTGPMPLYKLNIGDMSRVSTRQLAPPSGFFAPFAFQTSSVPGMVDIAYLQADLNQQTLLPIFRVGQLKTTDLDTFDPLKVSGPEVALAQLTFNKGAAAFQTFGAPSGDQFLASSRPLNDGTPGVTIVWIDALGRMRSSTAAMDGGSGWPTTLVGTIGVTFSGPPAASFAQLRIAWVEGQGGNPMTPPIFSMGGTCLP